MRDPPSNRRDHERRATWTLFENRASTQVLGFALMFAVTMTTFALYQADVVPHQNREVEFKHNGAMAGEMGELRTAMQQASTADSAASATVQLSPSYPGRAVAVNPPEPAGRLSTSGEHPVYVRGLYSTDERFWDGRSVQYATRHLNYSISYNRITGDEYALEAGMLVKKYANGNTRNLSAAPVNGDRISLALLGGVYDRTAHRESVEFSPVSTTSRSLTITAQRTDIDGDGSKEDPHIWLPTQLNQDEWTDIADAQDELVDAEVTDSGDSEVPAPAGNGDYVKLTLKDGQQYDFRVSRVTLGQPASVTPTYLTAPSGTVQIPERGSKPVTVTVRDEYGNPVSGADVTLQVAGNGNLEDTDGSPLSNPVRTGPDGQATAVFTGGGTAPGAVEADIGGGPESYRTIEVDITRPTTTKGQKSIYTSGQMLEDLSGFSELRLSNGRTVPTSDTDCLLVGDTGGGLLGSLLGGLQCDEDSFRTIQGSLLLEKQNNKELQLRYYLFDENGDDNINGHDGVTIQIDDKDGDKVFRGELKRGAAKDILRSGGTDLLDAGNYKTAKWEGDGGGWFSDDWGKSDPYDSFADLKLDKAENVFVEQAHGRVTVEAN
jgi:hypothetical protein